MTRQQLQSKANKLLKLYEKMHELDNQARDILNEVCDKLENEKPTTLNGSALDIFTAVNSIDNDDNIAEQKEQLYNIFNL